MCKISCVGTGRLRLGRDLERASGEAVVQISGGVLPLEGTGASHVLCHGCRNAHRKNRKTNGEAKTGTKQKKMVEKRV